MNYKKELNALKAYCTKLEKDLADLEGWKYKCTELQLRVTQIERNMELECFRAVAKERTQWENLEERLVQQLRKGVTVTTALCTCRTTTRDTSPVYDSE